MSFCCVHVQSQLEVLLLTVFPLNETNELMSLRPDILCYSPTLPPCRRVEAKHNIATHYAAVQTRCVQAHMLTGGQKVTRPIRLFLFAAIRGSLFTLSRGTILRPLVWYAQSHWSQRNLQAARWV
jgi:hypothetical protein